MKLDAGFGKGMSMEREILSTGDASIAGYKVMVWGECKPYFAGYLLVKPSDFEAFEAGEADEMRAWDCDACEFIKLTHLEDWMLTRAD